MMYFFESYRLIDYAGFISTVMRCVMGKEWQLVGLKTVRKTPKPFLVFYFVGNRNGSGKDGRETKPILRDIGNETFRSGICRLRSGIGNSNREHEHM